MATQVSTAKLNGIDTEQLRQTMDAVSANPESGIARFAVNTSWKGGTQSETRVDGWQLGGKQLPRQFTISIDEPPELLGTNTAANPQEYLLAAANACMMATYVAACSMQNIELESVQIETSGELDLRGFLGIDKNVKPGYDEVEYTVRIKGNGTREQFERVHEWVMKTSPNYWNLANPIRMVPRLVVES